MNERLGHAWLRGGDCGTRPMPVLPRHAVQIRPFCELCYKVEIQKDVTAAAPEDAWSLV